MSYRYLPWTRRGLAAEVTAPDAGNTIAARAEIGVRLLLNTGRDPRANLRLYGPGDVIGIDPRVIVRLDPRRLTHDAEPDKLAAIEFDPPDFPWMFTPAAPGGQERLRPWCVLVVVGQQPGVEIQPAGDRPLPRLAIGSPARPDTELPDLAESWGWAHTQLLEDGTAGSIPDKLASQPNLNVSRVVCPRRLEPGRAYYACLVPAFEAGRRAGLGQPVPAGPNTGPAWGSGGGAPTSIELPLYFHWEFKTGPAGDFESLARRLTPRSVPEGVGRKKTFLGAADRALPRLDPDDPGAILDLEGALRAPEEGAGSGLEDVPAVLRTELERVLEAPGRHVVEGASADAEAVAPPLYAQWHVRQHEIPAERPRWFRELNLDPRQRANAGLGADVVRENQEEYMDAAWRQVGDIEKANRLLDLARLARELARRMHERHVARLDPSRLLRLTAPIHRRLPIEDVTAEALIARSLLPPGATDQSFRRMTSPQSTTLKRAARLGGAQLDPAAGVQVQVIDQLADGSTRLEPVAGVPDGLLGSRLLDEIKVAGVADETRVATVEGLAEVRAGDVRAAREAATRAAETPIGDLKVRPDIAMSGMVVGEHLRQLDAGPTANVPVSASIPTMVAVARTNREAVGFVVPAEVRHEAVQPLNLTRANELEVGSGLDATVVGRLAPGVARELRSREASPLIGELDATALELDPEDAGDEEVALERGVGVEALVGVDAVAVAPLIRDQAVITRFSEALERYVAVRDDVAASIVPAPAKLELAQLKQTIVSATEPVSMILSRVATRVKIGGLALSELAADVPIRVGEDLDPVLAFPTFERAMYLDLKRYDQERLLPGVGRIEPDTVTLVETNPRFVEAFLIGMNHEMNREELWRGFPTDRRGTPFQRFWDRFDDAADIPPLHEFKANVLLGNNSLGDVRGSIVMLVRGDLLRRYPNSIIYAAPALPNGRIDETPAVRKDPVFGGRLDPDITFVGFDLTVETITPEPGWLFVIQEQPTEPRFGLDVPADGGDPALARWSDLTWGHAGVAPGAHLKLGSGPLAGRDLPLAGGAPARATFALDAAHLAAITFQRPFRAAIHSRDVLKGVKG